tara:strand:+ start:15918 stop:16058 length:141 start_codon:yes stop_codon:yes gene_type:complete
MKEWKLDIKKSMINNFNVLRISLNDPYLAYFILNNQKYISKIYKDE